MSLFSHMQKVGFFTTRLNWFFVVIFFFSFCQIDTVCIDVAKCDLVHDAETVHGLW